MENIPNNIDKYNVLNFSSRRDSYKIINLWNNEVGHIFPISRKMFNQNICDSKYLDYECSYVVYDGKNLVGFILGKIYDNNEIIEKYINKGWISLVYVKREYRKQGIGSFLLDKLELEMRKKNVYYTAIGSDLDCFFPGIPNDFDNLSDKFFKKRGYNMGYYTHDLVKKLNKFDVNIFNEYVINNEKLSKDITVCYASIDDKEILLNFLKKCFYGRWYFEALEYFENAEKNIDSINEEYLIAKVKCDNDLENFNKNCYKVVGFLRVNKQLINKISYNIMWSKRFKKLVGIGPLGVDIDYRKQGIATYLLLYAFKDCFENNYSDAMIDWTGLVTYYQKFGFQVWKCYQYANKELLDK